MISRHDIRQTAVQFLYGVGLQPEGAQTGELCDFSSWDIVLEPVKADLARARVKAVEHLARARAAKVNTLQTKAEAAVLAMKDDLATSDLRDSIKDILKREDALDDAIKSLKAAARNKDMADISSLEALLNTFFIANETLLQLRSRVLTMVQDYPVYASVLSSLSSALAKMQEMGEQLRGVEHPEQSPNKSEILKVVDGVAGMEELHRETEKLVRGVLSQLDEIDATIAGTTDNFSPTRVSPVDRAILRIAAYELKNCPELPVPVIIKEAILLAESYSVNEATKFVNGVLAGVSSIYRNQDSARA